MGYATNAIQEERGSALVLTALMMVTLLGFLALGIDLGFVLVTKRTLANAADAAALAGVQELPGSGWNARARAFEYGLRNKLQSDEMTVEVSVSQNEVAVTAQRAVKLFFAPMLGVNEIPVRVHAKARTGPVSGIGGVVPLSVEEGEFAFGEQYLLKEGARPSPLGSGDSGKRQGNFGPLALGGRGANNYLNRLKYGYKTVLRVGDVVETETGNMAGPTAEGIAWRTKHPDAAQCSFEKANATCPQYVVVPVVGEREKGGRGPVTIVGFAAFFLEGTTRNGAENYVVGRFLQRVVDGEVGNSNDYGLRASRLVE